MAADYNDGMDSKHATRAIHMPVVLKAAWIIVPSALNLFAASHISTDFGYVVTGIPIFFFFWIALIAWSAHHLGRSQRWSKRSDTRTVVSAAVIMAVITFFPVLHACNYLGGALRFAMTRSIYDREVAFLPAEDKPHLAVFNWGGMIWSSRGVVYDESDEIVLPQGQQSAAWLDIARKSELGCGHWNENRLWDHYYLVSFPC